MFRISVLSRGLVFDPKDDGVVDKLFCAMSSTRDTSLTSVGDVIG